MLCQMQTNTELNYGNPPRVESTVRLVQSGRPNPVLRLHQSAGTLLHQGDWLYDLHRRLRGFYKQPPFLYIWTDITCTIIIKYVIRNKKY